VLRVLIAIDFFTIGSTLGRCSRSMENGSFHCGHRVAGGTLPNHFPGSNMRSTTFGQSEHGSESIDDQQLC
jgi:hypothetical protein